MEADYVIIGSGSAGFAMAGRLSAAGRSVLVLEFGGSDAGRAVLSDEHGALGGIVPNPNPIWAAAGWPVRGVK